MVFVFFLAYNQNMSKSVGAASGCVVWLITFAVLSMCMCPAAMIVAGIVPVTNPRQVEALVDPILCPADSAATITHYATTIRDDMGADLPATGYEMHCITPAGQTVRSYEGSFGFALIGILGAVALLVAGGLAFALAAPAGLIIARLFPKKSNP